MSINLLANKRIAIIGGGPVGLTTALLLQQKGANVKLYERDASSQIRITGGSLDMHQHTGQRALKEAGLLDEFYQLSYPPSEKMMTLDGQVFREEAVQEETKRLKPEIDRNDLRQLLCKQLKGHTVVWGRKLVSLHYQTGQYRLQFEGGFSETADIVIGANGGRSNLRGLVNDAPTQYTNTYLIQGRVVNPGVECPNFTQVCQDSNIVVIGEGHALATHYIANGSLVFDISFRQAEDWFEQHQLALTDQAAVVDFLAHTFGHWSPIYHELFRASREFKGYPMRYIPLDVAWKEHHHITLVGDAAHLMPPFAGVGVNIGLVDALTLSENLTNGRFGSIDAAIADYETTMFGYARQALQASLQAEVNIHADKKLGEVWQQKAEWDEQLAHPQEETLLIDTALQQFQQRVEELPALGKTLKFVVGETILFIDGTHLTNRSTHLDQPADCSITLSRATFEGLLSGKLKTMVAFMSGKLKVKGDMGVAMQAKLLFGS